MTELRPPAEFAHLRWHFLRGYDGEQDYAFAWYKDIWTADATVFSQKDMAKYGWTYVGPAVAVNPNDDAQVQSVARMIDPAGWVWFDHATAADAVATMDRRLVFFRGAMNNARAALHALVRGE